jgi:hypothetical protein
MKALEVGTKVVVDGDRTGVIMSRKVVEGYSLNRPSIKILINEYTVRYDGGGHGKHRRQALAVME